MTYSKSFAILFSVIALLAHGQAPRLNDWKVIGPGGGGTMISPTISPHDSKLVVEFCDMTGGYITHDNGQSWRMFNLRGGINKFAFDPANDNVIYAGNAALWRTADRGRTWTMLFPSPSRNTMEHQVGDHSDYLLTSDDSSYPGGSVSGITIDPAHPDHLYVTFDQHSLHGAGTASTTVMASIDGGTNWHNLATLPPHVAALSIHNGSVVVIADSAAYRISVDGEVRKMGRVPGQVKSASSASSGTDLWLYATNTEGQLFLSQNSGVDWKAVTPSLGQLSGRFEAVGVGDLHPEVAYVGFRGLQLPSGPENLYNGIAKTIDGGRKWRITFKEAAHAANNLQSTWIEERALQDGATIWFDSAYSLGVAPSNPDIVYATDLFRTYRTLDGGATWAEMNSSKVGEDTWTTRGLDVTTDYGVQFDPFDVKHMFIDYTDIGLFQSLDAGSSWRSSTDGIPESWRNTTYWLAFDSARRGQVWGAFSGVHDLPRPKMFRTQGPSRYTGGVGVSADGGLHWKPSGTGMPSTSITHIIIDPGSPVGKRTLYATAFGRGVYKTVDDGKTWTLKNTGIDGAEPFVWRLTRAQDDTLYLVVARRNEGLNTAAPGNGALYRSVDKAEHWQRLDLPDGVTGPTGLTVDPGDKQRLYLTSWGQEGSDADHGGGVYLSINGGKSWKPLYTGMQHVYDLTLDPRHPDTLYICGFDAAAMRSIDRGVHWSRIAGYNFKWGHRVIIDPVDSTQIYITTYGGGVWHGPAAGDNTHSEDVATPVHVAQ